MLPNDSQSYHQLESNPHNRLCVLREPCLVNVMDGRDCLSSRSEKKSTEEACRSHKEAERRRRQRINAHLSTLRTLLPKNSTKRDKASLLADVVRHVRELRKQASAYVAGGGGGTELPGESDEASLSSCDGDARTMRVTVCCDDRPGLNRELAEVIGSVHARAVRAEMTTVGGRTKSVVVVQWNNAGGGGEEDAGVFRRALRSVVDNRRSFSSSSGLGLKAHENKRVRIQNGDSDDNEFGIRKESL